jgi:hypothetical protein
MSATSFRVSQETRKLLESLKTGGETFDDVIRGLIVSNPNRLTVAKLSRRIRDGHRHPIEGLVVESRRQNY